MKTLGLIVALAWLAAFAAGAADKVISVDGYAAVVNDQVITIGEVMGVMQPVERQLRQTYDGSTLTAKLEEAYSNALTSLIERALIIEAFKQQKEFTLPDTVVNSRMDELIRNKFNNNRAALMKALEEEGLTLEDWRQGLKNSMIVSLLREREVDSKVVISPQAVREAYEKAGEQYRIPEQVDVRMIVIHRGQTEEETALKYKQAEDVRQRLLAGANFEELAKQVSEGPRAAAGGVVGWIDPASRRAELAEALQNMDPGDISEVIPAGDDFYILKVEGRRNATVIPFEKVQDTLRTELQKKEAKRLYDAWIVRLRQKVYIRKF